MAITSGNDNIHVKYEQARALNNQNMDAAKNQSVQEKNEAVNAFEEAWGKVNTHEGGDSTGVVQELSADFWDAAGKAFEAGWETIEDAITQSQLIQQDLEYNQTSAKMEAMDKASNMLGNTWNGIKSVGNHIFGGIAEAFEEGTKEGHTEEA